jgi:hypothetical protein
MPLTPAIRQPAGMFSAASLFGLADVGGTTLARYHAPADTFALNVQSSISLVGNTNTGNATSRSTLVSAGRRLIVTTISSRNDLVIGQDRSRLPSSEVASGGRRRSPTHSPASRGLAQRQHSTAHPFHSRAICHRCPSFGLSTRRGDACNGRRVTDDRTRSRPSTTSHRLTTSRLRDAGGSGRRAAVSDTFG